MRTYLNHGIYIDLLLVITFIVLLSVMVSIANAGELPDPVLTPGVTRVVTLHELCTTSTNLVRNVPESDKKAVYKEYGMKGDDRNKCKEGFEIDHLVSLEIGGSNDIKNLWPQSYCGNNNAHIKDVCENLSHKLVCDGTVKLEDAQKGIASNWIKWCASLK